MNEANLNMKSTEELQTRTICSALELKYCNEKLDDCFVENVTISQNKKAVEIQNHERKLLTLDRCEITSSGEIGEFSKVCPLVEELDLSSNKISEWEQVFNIVSDLKHLTFLNISHNPLRHSQIKSGVDRSLLPKNLKKLAVNNIKYSFDVLVDILKLFPSIIELHASLNNFGELPETNVIFDNVTSLHFVNNNISSWKNIEKLGNLFPSLKTLVIAENPIEEIPANPDVGKHFPCLEKLSITDTLISKWECLDQLCSLPLLTDVRFVRLPLWDNHADEKLRHQLLIARLPTIKHVNGGKIDETEIEDAERAFLRYYSKLPNQPKRYTDLVNIHGVPPELVDIDFSRIPVVSVHLKGDIEQETELQLSSNLTLLDLRKMIAERYELSLSEFRLYYRDKSIGNRQEEMRLNTQTLSRYDLKDGDEIFLQRFMKKAPYPYLKKHSKR